MRRIASAIVVGAVVLAAVGCCKKKASPSLLGSGSTSQAADNKGPDKAPTPKWGPREVYFGDGSMGRASLEGTSYELHVQKFPAGTKLTADGQDTVVGPDGTAVVKLDVGSDIGALSPKAALDYQTKITPKSKVHVTYPNGVQFDLELAPQDVSYQLKKAIEKLKDSQPLRFGKDEKPPAQHTVLYIWALTPEVIGPGATMKDVDWVAVSENLPARTGKMCSGYKPTTGTGAAMDLPLQMVDQDVSIYDRVSANLIEKKTFKASERCPMFASGGAATTYPDSEQVKRWLRERRTKK